MWVNFKQINVQFGGQLLLHQAPAVQRVARTIQRINHYSVDKYHQTLLCYSVDTNLSIGKCYPSFEHWSQSKIVVHSD